MGFNPQSITLQNFSYALEVSSESSVGTLEQETKQFSQNYIPQLKMKKFLTLSACLFMVVFLTGEGCEPAASQADIDRASETRRETVRRSVEKYEAKRDALKEELKQLTAMKLGLEEGPTNVIQTNIVQTNIVQIVVTNFISPADTILDGRLTARMRVEEEFKTQEIYVLPYSPHEFIFKMDGHVYYGYCSGMSKTAEVYFRIFE